MICLRSNFCQIHRHLLFLLTWTPSTFSHSLILLNGFYPYGVGSHWTIPIQTRSCLTNLFHFLVSLNRGKSDVISWLIKITDVCHSSSSKSRSLRLQENLYTCQHICTRKIVDTIVLASEMLISALFRLNVYVLSFWVQYVALLVFSVS